MDHVLKAENLCKAFGALKAVDGLSLAVAKGEVFGLIGPDGAGKTTAMRMLCGLSRPDAGSIEILGFRLPKQKRKAHFHMGYMPQQYSMYGDLTVEENLRFYAGMNNVPRRLMKEREARLLEIARLDKFRDRPARTLSGGMYKKLALSCALIHQPEVLLLDEPTIGVDPISRRELWAFLYELVGDGVAVLVCTPYMDEAERCNRVGLLLDGRLVTTDTPAALKANFSETVFELETDPLPSAENFAGLDGISQTYLVGRKTHVLSSLGPAFAPRLKEMFEQHDIQVLKLTVVPAAFEDIFLHMTRNVGLVVDDGADS